MDIWKTYRNFTSSIAHTVQMIHGFFSIASIQKLNESKSTRPTAQHVSVTKSNASYASKGLDQNLVSLLITLSLTASSFNTLGPKTRLGKLELSRLVWSTAVRLMDNPELISEQETRKNANETQRRRTFTQRTYSV